MSANINFTNIQKIIEANMRAKGYGPPDVSDEFWKDEADLSSINPDYPGGLTELAFNMKLIRDIISQSILDVLTGIVGTGSLSIGNTPGDPGKSGNNIKVKLNSGDDIEFTGDTLIAGALTTSGSMFANRKLLTGWAPISDDPVNEPAGAYHGLHPGGNALKKTYMHAVEITSLNNISGTPQNLSMENWTGAVPDWYTYNPGWDSMWREESIIKDGTYGFGGSDIDPGAEPFLRAQMRDSVLPLAGRVVTWTMWQRADALTNLAVLFTELGEDQKLAHYNGLAANTWFNFYVTKLMTSACGTSGHEVEVWPFRHSADAHVGNYYGDAGHMYANVLTTAYPNESSGDFILYADDEPLTLQTSITNVEANINSFYLDPVNHAVYVNVDGDPSTKTIYWASKVRSQVIKTSELDLSEAGGDKAALHAERDFFIYKAQWLYTEGSSVDAGVGLRAGKESDNNYYYDGTSETSKSQWYTKDITADIVDKVVVAGDTLTFGMAGSKVGAGKVCLCLEVIFI